MQRGDGSWKTEAQPDQVNARVCETQAADSNLSQPGRDHGEARIYLRSTRLLGISYDLGSETI